MSKAIDDILARINASDSLYWDLIHKAAINHDHELLKKALELKDFMDLIFNLVAALKGE